MRLKPVLALLLVAAACERSPTAPTGKFLVTAYATPQSVRTGAATNVIIAITNVSNVPQSYESNFCGPAYHIANQAGVRVDPGASAQACFTFSAIKTVAPGQQDVYATEWTAATQGAAGPGTTPLPAGTYTITGALVGTDIQNVPFTLQITP